MNHGNRKPEIRTWETADGVPIHCRVWENETAASEIWIVHGMGDHGGRYLELAGTLVHSGFRVILADHRGNGLSGGRRGYVPRFDSYLSDLETTIEKTRSGRKGYLLGQSMGSLIVARFLQQRPSGFERALLFSPMFRTTRPPPRFKLLMAGLLRYICPRVTFRVRFATSELTSDEKRKAEYRQDPLKHGRVSPELGWSVFRQGELAIQLAGQIEVPTLVMHGEIDRITSPRAAAEFAEKNPLIEFVSWPGMRHELYNEPENQKVLDTAIHWLKGTLSPGSDPCLR